MITKHSIGWVGGTVSMFLFLELLGGHLTAGPLPPETQEAQENDSTRQEVTKELREEILLPSGTEVDKSEQQEHVMRKGSPKSQLFEFFSPGPSEARSQIRLWLVRAASYEQVGALGQRLSDNLNIEVLASAADGVYTVRGTEKEMRPVRGWEETEWLGELEWRLKLPPEFKQAIDAMQANEPIHSQTKVYIGQDLVEPELHEPVGLQSLAGHEKSEPTVPLEVWLFRANELSGFIDRLEESLGLDRRIEEDGAIHFGRIIIAPQIDLHSSRFDNLRQPSWMQISGLPLWRVPAIAADLSVSRVLPAPAVQGFQSPEGARCKAKLEEYGVGPTAILARRPGIWMAPEGLDGSGEIIAHADTGLDSGGEGFFANPDLLGRLLQVNEEDVARSLVRQGDWSDLTGHGTHTAGLLVASGESSRGRYRGVAPGAHIVHYSFGDDKGRFRVDSDALLYSLEDSFLENARIHSDSWGKPHGHYDSLSSELDRWIWNGGTPRNLLVVLAAGNRGQDGRGSIASPADAKNCLAVGAIETDNPTKVAAFSSRGPSVDGRIKPDLVAPGTLLVSTRPYEVRPLVSETMEVGTCKDWDVWPENQSAQWVASNEAHEGSTSLTDSRDGKYRDNTQTILASPEFDTSAASEISFWARWQVPEPSSHGFFILFGDMDSWEKKSAIRMPPWNPSWPEWDLVTLELPWILRYFRREIKVGFLLSSNDDGVTGDGVYIDDFTVSGWGSDCGLAEAGLAGKGSNEDKHYTLASGTSMATPLVAGLGARYRQYLRKEHALADPSAITLKAALINGSERPVGRGLPDYEMGFGSAGMALLERSAVLVREAIATGPVGTPVVIEVDVTSSDEALRATLVWFDSPGPNLNNDLDLKLRSPSGSVWPKVADSVNTVEDISVANPEAGRWTVEVAAGALQEDRVPFSLVVSGGIAEVTSLDNPNAETP